MKKNLAILSFIIAGASVCAYAQDEFLDDIYYNPKKDKTLQKEKKQKRSNYIADFSNMDVDDYNGYGDFMLMPADTIGSRAENGQDFIYTQQIQKYYNPTIVLDNAELLADVLNNSYGNVDIVINDNGVVGFAPYSYAYGWPYYGWPYGSGWGGYWGNWGWNVGWGYDPWYAWGPSWGWGPGWGPAWAWGPTYGWGPGWWPGYVPVYSRADYTPGGNRRSGAGGGWASSTRPGGNYAGNTGGHRVSGGRYTAPAGSTSYNRGTRRIYNTGTGNINSGTGSHRGYTFNGNSSTNKLSGSGTINNSGTTRRSYNGNTINNSNNPNNSGHRTYNGSTTNRSYNSGTYRSGSSSGSYRSSGGGMRSGGGGGRGTRR